MILVFGGTTEGKITASLLDWLGEDYIYSTRTQVKYKVGGEQIHGDLTVEKANSFCIAQKVKLIIDASHPFAVNVHNNIRLVSQQLKIPTIRYSRVFQSFDDEELVTFFDSYEDMVSAIQRNNSCQNILALTGVQTINNFKSLWSSKNIYFRILNTELSKTKAIATGVDMSKILPEDPKADASCLIHTCRSLHTQLLLSKESGESGFMDTKLEAAKELNIPLWIVKRPQLPCFDFEVKSDKELLQHIYRLRKNVLKKGDQLQSGFTTGVCVIACVKACFKALHEDFFQAEEVVELEGGHTANFKIFEGDFDKHRATCLVIKNSGDDPDVTHAEEIGCEIKLNNSGEITFSAGKGVGLVTLPGLQVAVGQPAINPGPRKMIIDQLKQLQKDYHVNMGIEVIPFIPRGEELAAQTFNPRIGIEGGLSILGTTGILRPFSSEAYVNSIRQYVSVAINNKCMRLILTPGKRSENMLKPFFPNEPAQAFIHIGNFVGESIDIAAHASVREIVLGIMIGKAIKLAEGNLDTHSSKVTLNVDFVCKLAKQVGFDNGIIEKLSRIKLANELWNILPIPEKESFFMALVNLIQANCDKIVAKRCVIKIFLLTPDGNVVGYGMVL